MSEKIILLISIIIFIAAIVIVLLTKYRERKDIEGIEAMLAAAVNGIPVCKSFNESELSKLEAKFFHYFEASEISSKNISAEKDKIKSLISDISHQTKTPIANLLLYSDLLLEADLDDEAHANVTALHAQADKLRFQIDALVKLSRLENGILKLCPAKEAFNPLISEVVALYEKKAADKGLVLNTQLSSAEAFFDRKWTVEALSNIIDNAIKYTEAGTVTISTSTFSMFARISVADTGIGIKEDEIPKIFARFYRSEAVKNFEGVGIGLHLARQIMQAQGGYIKVKSVLGAGSVFELYFPTSPQ